MELTNVKGALVLKSEKKYLKTEFLKTLTDIVYDDSAPGAFVRISGKDLDYLQGDSESVFYEAYGSETPYYGKIIASEKDGGIVLSLFFENCTAEQLKKTDEMLRFLSEETKEGRIEYSGETERTLRFSCGTWN